MVIKALPSFETHWNTSPFSSAFFIFGGGLNTSLFQYQSIFSCPPVKGFQVRIEEIRYNIRFTNMLLVFVLTVILMMSLHDLTVLSQAVIQTY